MNLDPQENPVTERVRLERLGRDLESTDTEEYRKAKKQGKLAFLVLMLIVVCVLAAILLAVGNSEANAQKLKGHKFNVSGIGFADGQRAIVTANMAGADGIRAKIYGPMTIDPLFPGCIKGNALIDNYSSQSVTINWTCPSGTITQQITNLYVTDETGWTAVQVYPTMLEQTK